MPLTYTIDPDRNVGTTKASGVLTEDEYRAAIAAVYADSRFHPDLRFLHDYSGVIEFKVSWDFISKLAASRTLSAKSRTAIWAVGPLNHGMARIFQTWVDNGLVNIFRDRAEALAWLNDVVPPEKWLK